jgi:hypothetical protein
MRQEHVARTGWKYIQNFGRKLEAKRPPGTPEHKLENNVKTNLT